MGIKLSSEEEEKHINDVIKSTDEWLENNGPDLPEEEISDEDSFPITDVSSDERKVLNSYRNYGYETINKFLRFGNSESLSQHKDMIEFRIATIDDVIERNHSLSDGVVYRIVEDEGFLKSSFTEPAFLSTSFDHSYIDSQTENYENPEILVIHVPKGTPYARVAEHAMDDFEGEVLLPRGGTLTKQGDHWNFSC